MRIKKNMNLRIISWSNTEFSELTLYELYGWQCEETQIWSESKRVKKDDNNSKLEPQFVFISHFVISSHPSTTIPRLQTNHD